MLCSKVQSSLANGRGSKASSAPRDCPRFNYVRTPRLGQLHFYIDFIVEKERTSWLDQDEQVPVSSCWEKVEEQQNSSLDCQPNILVIAKDIERTVLLGEREGRMREKNIVVTFYGSFSSLSAKSIINLY